MKLVREKIIEIEPTIHEIAECIWRMNCEDQAWMINHLAKISKVGGCMQLKYLFECDSLNDDGKLLLKRLGEYGDE